MGLVDYSDSESDSEPVQPPQPASVAAASKKPFKKLRSDTGKIVVNLASTSTADDDAVEKEPPAKRVKTAGASRFSSLGSFLPPPKRTGSSAPAASASKDASAPALGAHLRTGAAPAFVRDAGDGGDGETTRAVGDAATPSSGLHLPAPINGPSIPQGQKPEEEVKLVGKPLMFKPLSVARKKAPLKNKKPSSATPSASGATTTAAATQSGATPPQPAAAPTAEPPPKKKISLFSAGDDEPAPVPSTQASAASEATYDTSYDPYLSSAPEPAAPLDQDETDVTSAYPMYQPPPQAHAEPSPHDLAALTAGLSKAAQRELFGRAGAGNPPSNARVVRFDMEREYAHNEALRASGAQQAYNPVRAIAPGKHSLRQVVQVAQSNREALEESYARQRAAKGDAAGRYGWK
ncbi:hypothetical protein VTJ83DRAFT_1003 [Remersonia thermophila]|uniref:Mitotic checkpoint regulator, MAD2B-interacting-domain-containing protein n=1 Tax=Remersonia thermophila TaxID=72144 RepID=A0ABR4DN26_9PEZI